MSHNKVNCQTFITQILHSGECDMKIYRTLESYIALGESYIARGEAECDITFQSAINFHIARTQSAIFV